MRGLVVEDDADVSDALVDALALQSHHVDVLRDGAQALAVCQVEKFDTIILGLGLPRVHGLEVLRCLREAGHDTAILVLTARDQIDDRVWRCSFNPATHRVTRGGQLIKLSSKEYSILLQTLSQSNSARG